MFRRPLHNTLQASFICFYGLLPRLLPRRKGNADLFPFFFVSSSSSSSSSQRNDSIRCLIESTCSSEFTRPQRPMASILLADRSNQTRVLNLFSLFFAFLPFLYLFLYLLSMYIRTRLLLRSLFLSLFTLPLALLAPYYYYYYYYYYCYCYYYCYYYYYY